MDLSTVQGHVHCRKDPSTGRPPALLTHLSGQHFFRPIVLVLQMHAAIESARDFIYTCLESIQGSLAEARDSEADRYHETRVSVS